MVVCIGASCPNLQRLVHSSTEVVAEENQRKFQEELLKFFRSLLIASLSGLIVASLYISSCNMRIVSIKWTFDRQIFIVIIWLTVRSRENTSPVEFKPLQPHHSGIWFWHDSFGLSVSPTSQSSVALLVCFGRTVYCLSIIRSLTNNFDKLQCKEGSSSPEFLFPLLLSIIIIPRHPPLQKSRN